LQGNLSQNQRQIAMDGFRSGRVQLMVATDIAARGIDVSQISHVINYDVPDTAEAYTHRIGRTGRMSRLGTAFTLVTQEDLPMIRSIERLLSYPIERLKVGLIDDKTAEGGNSEPVPAYVHQPQVADEHPVRSERPARTERRPYYPSGRRNSQSSR
jgi:ATP-dependent RNA helicase RhlE